MCRVGLSPYIYSYPGSSLVAVAVDREGRGKNWWRVIIANCCVIIGIRAKSFTGVNTCLPRPQRLAFYQFQYTKGTAPKFIILIQPLVWCENELCV